MDMYKTLVRPLLFRMDPEASHHMAKPILRNAALCQMIGGGAVRNPRLEVRIGSLVLPNPVGVAPGFDKDCEMTAGLSRLGFGFLVPGTVMPEVRPGNAKKRIVRLPEQEALLNCLGLPSKGLDYSVAQLGRRQSAVPIIASFGSMDDEGYFRSFAALEPLADATEFNPRCFNNHHDPGTFLDVKNFERVYSQLVKRKTKPLFVKINTYNNEAERQDRLDMVERAMFYGVDGFSTQTGGRGKHTGLSIGVGSWSGRPVLERTMRAIQDIQSVTRGTIPIRARGGIFSGADAFQAIAAGASTVELLTAFVYEGWSVGRRINAELLAMMDREGIQSVTHLRGIATTAVANSSVL